MGRKIRIDLRNSALSGAIRFPSSKSLLNRALILQALSEGDIQFELENLSDDSKIMFQALTSGERSIDVGQAGTAMRFLTAYFSLQKDDNAEPIKITGSERMRERPIEPLVDALRALGAKIEYVERHGYAPLMIYPKELSGIKLAIRGNISSQFITALLLISWKINGGLSLQLIPPILSESYIQMTLSLMNKCGIASFRDDDIIQVPQQNIPAINIDIEPDWSSAAYFLALLATRKNGEIILSGLKLDSDQGDRKFIDVLKPFGIRYTHIPGGVLVYKDEVPKPKNISLYMADMPDQVQTILCLCAVLGVRCHIMGAENLRWKETDRIAAMQHEFSKMNIRLQEEKEELFLEPESISAPLEPFDTYHDHRMAMSFALFGTLFPVEIENPEVVVKSYPEFWRQLHHFGIVELIEPNP